MMIDDEMEFPSLFKGFLRERGYNAVSFTDPLLGFGI
jgi:hypothetical protein